jgi:uncharacterized membrane protein
MYGMSNHFSIKEVFARAWATLMAHKLLSFQLVITLGVLQAISSYVSRQQNVHPSWWYVAVQIVLTLVIVVFGIGLNYIFLTLARGGQAHYSNLVLPIRVLVRCMAVSLLAGLAVLVGFIFFIIPGLYLLLRFLFAQYAALDTEGDALTILSNSAVLTRGVKGKLMLLLLAIIGVNIVGFLALGVGLLVTAPLSSLVMVHTYLTLKAHVEAGA